MAKAIATLYPSTYNGVRIRYVDGLKIVHPGEVVGQDKNGTWLYIRSLRDDAPAKDWHFKITARILPAVIEA